MELRLLLYFEAVAKVLNFRRGGRRFFVLEAALSQQIGVLQGELGGNLFNRNSRRIELIEVGRVFLAGVKVLFEVAQRIL